MKILVVAAHPDDEVLGCGGTVRRLAKEGHDIAIAILGEGITSRHVHRDEAGHESVQALLARSQEVAAILGAAELFLEKFPDNRFDTIPLLDIVKAVELVMDKVRPETIFTHHGGDLNIDHVVTHRAVLTATRTMAEQAVTRLYAFEVGSSTEWAFQQFQPAFIPNVFIDIAETMADKARAMAAYESEVREFPHPRSSLALEANALRWGSVAGCEKAEAFQLIRSIKKKGEKVFPSHKPAEPEIYESA